MSESIIVLFRDRDVEVRCSETPAVDREALRALAEDAVGHGVAVERDAVVAFLRKLVQKPFPGGEDADARAAKLTASVLAEAIELGEHVPE